jgi:hypothetical protein
MYRAKTSTHCLVKTRHFLAPCNSPPAASQPLPLPWHAPKWVKDFSLGRSPRNPRKSHQALKAFQKKLCSATERGKKFIATLAPARASSIAIARPIPCEAPVTSAVFPSTLPTGDFLSLCHSVLFGGYVHGVPKGDRYRQSASVAAWAARPSGISLLYRFD